jgi:hypothetical protein
MVALAKVGFVVLGVIHYDASKTAHIIARLAVPGPP